MSILQTKRLALSTAILALIVFVATPVATFAQGRGRGRGKQKVSHQQKKNEKFKNGHDARDGRWDGRGPTDRDGRYGDDDYYNGRDRRDGRYDRNRDGIDDRTEIRNRALSVGYNEGYRAGRNDRASGRSRDYDNHGSYRDATSGYRSEYGSIDFYRSNFRDGFRRGYEDGYRNNSSRSGGWGGILGDILGRP